MGWERLRQQTGLALGLFSYLGRPLTLAEAEAQLRQRLERREARFLEMARELLYGRPGSPYARLLAWAGCGPGDLGAAVRAHGVEGALERLRDAGVRLSLEEFKSNVPICRAGLTVETAPADFDSLRVPGRSLEASTSGSRAARTRVLYDWQFLAEEAANERVLHEVHRLAGAAGAFWMPALPSISGIHNLLIQLKFRQPPERWFSHLRGTPGGRLALEYLAWVSRGHGLRVPRPRFTDAAGAVQVAAWVERQLAAGRTCYVKAFASSAVRVVQAAQERGLRLAGALFFTGGEPLTETRREYLAAAGVKAVPRYVTTETGLVGAGCGSGPSPGSMHLYTDRLALVTGTPMGQAAAGPAPFLFTTLSGHTGKVLLNAELGDAGWVGRRRCGCRFGQLGMDLHLEGVHSTEKLTGEGMTLPVLALHRIAAELVRAAGGGPDDFQFWEDHDERGLVRLTVAVSLRVPRLDEPGFVPAVLRRLRQGAEGGGIVADFWEQAGTLRLVRAEPEASAGFKLLPLLRRSPGR